ncbi:cell wall mannoprotein 1 family protein [Aspergillus fijiensis CBS 313.89]|uniref:Hydrophobic surface binding protein A n=1 Tax=Aspergillus fijiensis CBS 313.89 TaxID=1448319 RepID=A0A8G1VZ57_9EURO|nr:hydrophobic surface binding protein A [Aspergillus fijiensis CBS 313.89]RAK74689.1 hydrophobic surface binding protein A [Aspergillus fijiensis CBS 313.89]
MIARQLSVLLLATSALATPLHRRDAGTVLSELHGIGTDINALSTTLDSFDGTLTGAVTVQYAEIALENGLNQAITDVVASNTYATGDSASVTTSLVGLEPEIVGILGKLVDQKPGFTSAGVVSIVLADLHSLQNLTNKLSTEAQVKVTTADKATIASEIAEIDVAYFNAIASFS